MTEDRQHEIAQCLSQIKLNNRDAFARLYELTNKQLYGLILRIIPDRENAADVLQESFSRVWLNAGKYRSDLGNAWAWLCQLTRNCALDSVRHSSRRPLTLLEPDKLDERPAASDTEGYVKYDLQHCLNLLSTEKRNAIVQVYLHGLTQIEFATQIKRPVGTIKTWIRRGLLELQQCLD
jgi:RNA polymerase sigma-70 factor (ECF subfamily)